MSPYILPVLLVLSLTSATQAPSLATGAPSLLGSGPPSLVGGTGAPSSSLSPSALSPTPSCNGVFGCLIGTTSTMLNAPTPIASITAGMNLLLQSNVAFTSSAVSITGTAAANAAITVSSSVQETMNTVLTASGTVFLVVQSSAILTLATLNVASSANTYLQIQDSSAFCGITTLTVNTNAVLSVTGGQLNLNGAITGGGEIDLKSGAKCVIAAASTTMSVFINVMANAELDVHSALTSATNAADIALSTATSKLVLTTSGAITWFKTIRQCVAGATISVTVAAGSTSGTLFFYQSATSSSLFACSVSIVDASTLAVTTLSAYQLLWGTATLTFNTLGLSQAPSPYVSPAPSGLGGVTLSPLLITLTPTSPGATWAPTTVAPSSVGQSLVPTANGAPTPSVIGILTGIVTTTPITAATSTITTIALAENVVIQTSTTITSSALTITGSTAANAALTVNAGLSAVVQGTATINTYGKFIVNSASYLSVNTLNVAASTIAYVDVTVSSSIAQITTTTITAGSKLVAQGAGILSLNGTCNGGEIDAKTGARLIAGATSQITSTVSVWDAVYEVHSVATSAATAATLWLNSSSAVVDIMTGTTTWFKTISCGAGVTGATIKFHVQSFTSVLTGTILSYASLGANVNVNSITVQLIDITNTVRILTTSEIQWTSTSLTYTLGASLAPSTPVPSAPSAPSTLVPSIFSAPSPTSIAITQIVNILQSVNVTVTNVYSYTVNQVVVANLPLVSTTITTNTALYVSVTRTFTSTITLTDSTIIAVQNETSATYNSITVAANAATTVVAAANSSFTCSAMNVQQAATTTFAMAQSSVTSVTNLNLASNAKAKFQGTGHAKLHAITGSGQCMLAGGASVEGEIGANTGATPTVVVGPSLNAMGDACMIPANKALSVYGAVMPPTGVSSSASNHWITVRGIFSSYVTATVTAPVRVMDHGVYECHKTATSTANAGKVFLNTSTSILRLVAESSAQFYFNQVSCTAGATIEIWTSSLSSIWNSRVSGSQTIMNYASINAQASTSCIVRFRDTAGNFFNLDGSIQNSVRATLTWGATALTYTLTVVSLVPTPARTSATPTSQPTAWPTAQRYSCGGDVLCNQVVNIVWNVTTTTVINIQGFDNFYLLNETSVENTVAQTITAGDAAVFSQGGTVSNGVIFQGTQSSTAALAVTETTTIAQTTEISASSTGVIAVQQGKQLTCDNLDVQDSATAVVSISYNSSVTFTSLNMQTNSQLEVSGQGNVVFPQSGPSGSGVINVAQGAMMEGNTGQCAVQTAVAPNQQPVINIYNNITVNIYISVVIVEGRTWSCNGYVSGPGWIQVSGQLVANYSAAITSSVSIQQNGQYIVYNTAGDSSVAGDLALAEANAQLAIRQNGQTVHFKQVAQCVTGATISYHVADNTNIGQGGVIMNYASTTNYQSFGCNVQLTDDIHSAVTLHVQKMDANGNIISGGRRLLQSGPTATWTPTQMTYAAAPSAPPPTAPTAPTAPTPPSPTFLPSPTFGPAPTAASAGVIGAPALGVVFASLVAVILALVA